MSTTRGHHLIGKIIGGCLLEELLGHGGSSAVFLAQQSVPQRKVAVKVFLPPANMDLQMQKDFYKHFLHEAEAASKLDHPHILSIYAYGEQDGLPYIIMPYMPGGTLYRYVTKHGPLPLSQAQLYLEQLASALDYAHAQGCVHCDVKPANVLLDEMGYGVLSDFGIARIMQTDPATGFKVARGPETLMGTPNYISPEQALGEPVDGRSDVYSLGVSLFFLLAGRPPFRADSSIAMALLHVHQPPPSLCSYRADVSPYVDSVIGTALAKLPEHRFQTAGEFSAAFAQAISASGGDEHVPASQWRTGVIDTVPALPRNMNRAALQSAAYQKRSTLHLKPAWMALVAVAVLALTLGATFATGLMTSRATRATPHVPVMAPPPLNPGALTDRLLGNQDEWPASSTFFFSKGQYYIINKSPRNVALALYADHSFANLRMTVTLAEIQGPQNADDYYGVVIRAASDQSAYYLFEVTAWNGGQYAFLRYNGQYETLATGSVPSLHLKTGQSNTITIEAVGNTFTFIVNGKVVGNPVIDSSNSALTSGEVGLYVEERYAEVAFSHLHITPLK